MGFFRQENWSGLLFPPPGGLPDPGIDPTSPTFAGRFFTTGPLGQHVHYNNICRDHSALIGKSMVIIVREVLFFFPGKVMSLLFIIIIFCLLYNIVLVLPYFNMREVLLLIL